MCGVVWLAGCGGLYAGAGGNALDGVARFAGGGRGAERGPSRGALARGPLAAGPGRARRRFGRLGGRGRCGVRRALHQLERVDRDRDLAALARASVGQARSAMALEAAQVASDPELAQNGIANSGRVEAVAPLAGAAGRWVVVTREQTTAALERSRTTACGPPGTSRWRRWRRCPAEDGW